MVKVWRIRDFGRAFGGYWERFYCPEVETLPKVGERFEGKQVVMCAKCKIKAEPGFDIYQISIVSKKDMAQYNNGDPTVEEVFYIAKRISEPGNAENKGTA